MHEPISNRTSQVARIEQISWVQSWGQISSLEILCQNKNSGSKVLVGGFSAVTSPLTHQWGFTPPTEPHQKGVFLPSMG